mgnify:CR=1 FL=1
MEQEELQREMAAVMRQLPLERQRQLLALAQTLQEAERSLAPPPDQGEG